MFMVHCGLMIVGNEFHNHLTNVLNSISVSFYGYVCKSSFTTKQAKFSGKLVLLFVIYWIVSFINMFKHTLMKSVSAHTSKTILDIQQAAVIHILHQHIKQNIRSNLACLLFLSHSYKQPEIKLNTLLHLINMQRGSKQNTSVMQSVHLDKGASSYYFFILSKKTRRSCKPSSVAIHSYKQ